MKLCLLSDSHDHRHLLAAAVEQAKRAGAQAVLHCGDVVAPSTLRVLQRHGLPVHVIHGNNAGDLVHLCKLAQEPNSVIHFHGQDARLEFGGRKIFLVHYPHYAYAMACTGDYDIVCCGHEHKTQIARVRNVKGGETILLNPGTVGGVGAPPTYMLCDLATLEFNVHEVDVAPAAKSDARMSVHESAAKRGAES